MKNYITSLKRFISDRLNLYFILALAIFSITDYLIWTLRLRYEDIYIFSVNDVYPIRFLGIMVLINTILAFFSYDKEKEISYLLLGASIFISILIFVLEVFYLFSLNYG